MAVTRRQFMKVSAAGLAASSVGALGFTGAGEALAAGVRPFKLERATETRNACPYCAVACGVLCLHALRLVQLERRMHLLQDRDTSSLSAAQRFEAGALVVPVVLDTDWLARHRTAYAALGHNGIVFTGRDHLRFDWTTPPDIYVRKYIYSPENDWAWIGDHIRKGGLPELRQVMVLGAPSSGSAAWPELEQTLRERYHPVWHDDYTQVWTLDTE